MVFGCGVESWSETDAHRFARSLEADTGRPTLVPARQAGTATQGDVGFFFCGFPNWLGLRDLVGKRTQPPLSPCATTLGLVKRRKEDNFSAKQPLVCVSLAPPSARASRRTFPFPVLLLQLNVIPGKQAGVHQAQLTSHSILREEKG